MNDARLPLVSRNSRSNFVRAFKANGCAVCKRRYPELDWSDLHVDHIDPRDKPRGSAVSMPRGGSVTDHRTGLAELLAELLLCQVLCADCHKAKHRNGNGNGNGAVRQLELFHGNGSWHYGQ